MKPILPDLSVLFYSTIHVRSQPSFFFGNGCRVRENEFSVAVEFASSIYSDDSLNF